MIGHRRSVGCPREDEVLDLVAIGQWPGRPDVELSAHVQSCPSCATVAVAASTVAHLREVTPTAVPDAVVVWHRAQIRTRQESTARALIPMNVIVGVAAASAAGLAAAWWATGGQYLGGVWRAVATRGEEVAATLGSIPESAARALESSAAETAAGLVPAVATGLGVGLIVVSLAFVVAKVVDR
jgi:hypothetical protein